MKETMKRVAALLLCMVQLFGCLSQGHVHAHAEECTHPNAENTNTYYSLTAEGEWVDNGDGTHSGMSRLVKWWYCFDCGTGWPEYMTEPAMNTEKHQLEEGVCYRCGYENTCEHPKASLTKEKVWFSVDGQEYEPLDGDCHVIMNEPAIRWECQACGETWFDHVTGVLDELVLDHVYADGSNVCIDCGYVDDCAHTQTKIVQKEVGPIESEGMTQTTTTHTFWYQSYDAEVCADCGKNMRNNSNWQTYSKTEPHRYTDAYYCFDCGYLGSECPHEDSTQTGGHKENERFARIDAQTHLHMFDVHWDYVCADCGETYSLYIEAGSEVRDHAFIVDPSLTACNQCGLTKPCAEHSRGENGVCTVCGDCPHTDNVICDYRNEVADPEAYNAEFHKVVNTSIMECECMTCGVRFMDYSPYVVYQAHRYDESGVCACGATGEPTTCAHASENYETREENVVYSEITEESHKKTYDYYFSFYCLDCGQTTQYEVLLGYEKTEAHTLENGACACGYAEGGCTHPNIEMTNTYYSLCEGGEWADNGDGTHSGYSRLVNWWYCFDCGTGTPEYVTEPAMNTEPHTLVDGVCTRCGGINPCEHPAEAVEKKNVWNWVDGSYVEPLNGDKHVMWMQPAIWHQCSACGESWYDRVSGVLDDFTMNHEYADGSNVCTECGYVDDCAHAQTETVVKHVGPDETKGFTQATTTHTFWYQSHDAVVCADCGKDMNSNSNWVDYQKTEEHLYTDSYVCFYCGYHGSDCPHENSTQTGGHKENETFIRMNGTTHLHMFDVYWDYACADCGETYSLFIEQGAEVEDHAFIVDPGLTACNQCGIAKPCTEHSYGDNGVCTVCGDCPHTSNVVKDFSSATYDPQAHDEKFHKVPNSSTVKRQCNTCGVTYMTYSSYVVYKAHVFDESGVCVCGAQGETSACAHSRTDYATHEENVSYSEITAENHTKTYDYYFYYYCLDCGEPTQYEELLGRVVTQTHTFEDGVCACGYECAHDYVDGVCTICGMEGTTCAHPNGNQTGGHQENQVFTKLNETQHVYTFDVYWDYECPDCGEAYSVFIEQGFEFDDHAYVHDESLTSCNLCGAVKPCEEHTADENGVCSVCGDCAHLGYRYDSHIGMDFHDPVYQDEQFHVQPYTSYNRYLCSKCSAYFIRSSTMEGEEAHTYDENGLCACGAEGEPTTCEHANIEWGEREYATYSEQTLTQHTEKADIYWCGWCPDCETIRQRQLDMPGTAVTENHSYVGGTCSACGHHYLTGIENVYALPEGLKEIEAEAFVENNVEAVMVPDSCVKIGAVAFADCAQLKVVVLPRNTENISRDAFTGCPDVVIFVAEGSAAKAFCEANSYNYLVVE